MNCSPPTLASHVVVFTSDERCGTVVQGGESVRVTVDPGRCHGHQMCAIAAPEVFGSDDYGNAVVLIDSIPAELRGLGAARRGQLPRAGHHARRRKLNAMHTDETPSNWITDYDIFDPGFVRDPYPMIDRDPRVGMPDRPHRAMGWLVDADPLRRHRRHRPGARRLHVAQHHRRAATDAQLEGPYGGVAAPPITSDPPEHHWHRRTILPTFAPQASPSTKTARGRCAIS